MTIKITTTFAIIMIGIFIPFISNMIGGLFCGFDSFQYFRGKSVLVGIVLIEIFNIIPIFFSVSYFLKRKYPIGIRIIPIVFCYLALIFMHFFVDFLEDAQAAIVLAFIPIYAMVPFLVGAVIALSLSKIFETLRRWLIGKRKWE